MIHVRSLALVALALLPAAAARASERSAPAARAGSVHVTILSTMLADEGIGEWGFAALVEVDGHRILFDSGARPMTVLENSRELQVDLSAVEDVVLSHNHSDHTGGLVSLRRAASAVNPKALWRTHVAPGIFWERPVRDPARSAPRVRKEYEDLGGTVVEHEGPFELFPGVWVTGPVPRVHPERNWSATGQVRSPQGLVEDTIPESQSLVIDTDRGLVVVSGCGHAGIVNTLEYARKAVREAPILAVLGGFHLFGATDDQLAWTGGRLRAMGVANLVGAHCTGIEAVFRLRELAGLDRRHAVVGAVGASFDLEKGIDPLSLAR